MKAPRRAIILAAGFGSRMSPLSHNTPKPLMPLWGRPLIMHTLETLYAWGTRDVLINLHHSPAPLLSELVTGPRLPLRLDFSFEPEILGTGGALRRADWFPDNEPFWIVNGDIAMDVEPRHFIDAFYTLRPMAVLWTTASAGPRTVEVSRGLVRSFAATAPGSQGTFTFCGLHLASPELMDLVRSTSYSSIIDIYTRAISGGSRIAGVCVKDSFWADTGTVDDYIAAHRRILDCHRRGLPGKRLISSVALKRQSAISAAGVIVDGFAAVGGNVTIAPGARLADAVIWDDADIRRHARIRNAVVGNGTTVRGTVERMALRADLTADTGLLDGLCAAGFSPSTTTLQPLAPRGSARTFTRAACGSRRVMVMQYNAVERPENALYESNTRLLARLGVRVPRIIVSRPDHGLLVMEDVGDDTLLRNVAGRTKPAIVRRYRKVLDAILPMHCRGAAWANRSQAPLAEPFSETLYDWEHRLFIAHFLRGQHSLAPARISAALSDLRLVAGRLMKEPPALIHRDLQSTNILFHGGEPVFVDFQGMRIGAAVYDLASLLCDPYVSLPDDCRDSLLDYYAVAVGRSPLDLKRIFWSAAVQRLAQAIGAYARLGGRRETERFRCHIAPALVMLDRALKHMPELHALGALIANLCNEEVKQRMRQRGGHT